MSKPKVTLKCVADLHTGLNERIIEFSHGHDGTGGLISFHVMEDGKLYVEVYRCDNVVIGNERRVNADLLKACKQLLQAVLVEQHAVPGALTGVPNGRVLHALMCEATEAARDAIANAEHGA